MPRAFRALGREAACLPLRLGGAGTRCRNLVVLKEHLPQKQPRGDQAPRGTTRPELLRTTCQRPAYLLWGIPAFDAAVISEN